MGYTETVKLLSYSDSQGFSMSWKCCFAASVFSDVIMCRYVCYMLVCYHDMLFVIMLYYMLYMESISQSISQSIVDMNQFKWLVTRHL